MPIGLADLFCGQFLGSCPNQQGSRVGWVIDSHRLNDGLRRALKVQVAPAPDSHLTILDAAGEVFIRAAFRPLRSRMHQGPMASTDGHACEVFWAVPRGAVEAERIELWDEGCFRRF